MSDLITMSGGPSSLKQPDGVRGEILRIGQQMDLMVTHLHGELKELASRGQLFYAASQAATTTTIALATTYTGLCLSNPAGNTMNLTPRMLGVALSVAPAGIAAIALGGGFVAAGVVTHTTPLTAANCQLGNAAAPTGKADAAATLVGTPAVMMPLENGFTAGALYAGRGMFNLAGAPSIKPGGYIFVYTLTVVVGLFGIWWTEEPV